MKKYLFAICVLSLFLVGCSGKKDWKAGCEAGISSAIEEMGMAPNKKYIKERCAEWADAEK